MSVEHRRNHNNYDSNRLLTQGAQPQSERLYTHSNQVNKIDNAKQNSSIINSPFLNKAKKCNRKISDNEILLVNEELKSILKQRTSVNSTVKRNLLTNENSAKNYKKSETAKKPSKEFESAKRSTMTSATSNFNVKSNHKANELPENKFLSAFDDVINNINILKEVLQEPITVTSPSIERKQKYKNSRIEGASRSSTNINRVDYLKSPHQKIEKNSRPPENPEINLIQYYPLTDIEKLQNDSEMATTSDNRLEVYKTLFSNIKNQLLEISNTLADPMGVIENEVLISPRFISTHTSSNTNITRQEGRKNSISIPRCQINTASTVSSPNPSHLPPTQGSNATSSIATINLINLKKSSTKNENLNNLSRTSQKPDKKGSFVSKTNNNTNTFNVSSRQNTYSQNLVTDKQVTQHTQREFTDCNTDLDSSTNNLDFYQKNSPWKDHPKKINFSRHNSHSVHINKETLQNSNYGDIGDDNNSEILIIPSSQEKRHNDIQEINICSHRKAKSLSVQTGQATIQNIPTVNDDSIEVNPTSNTYRKLDYSTDLNVFNKEPIEIVKRNIVLGVLGAGKTGSFEDIRSSFVKARTEFTEIKSRRDDMLSQERESIGVTNRESFQFSKNTNNNNQLNPNNDQIENSKSKVKSKQCAIF